MLRGRPGDRRARRREQGQVRVADDRDARLGLQVHPVDVLAEVELAERRGGRPGVGRVGRAKLGRVPVRPGVPELVDPGRVAAGAVEGVRGVARSGGGRPGPCASARSALPPFMLVRTMCVWSSKTNTSWGTPFSAYAAVSYISTGLTLKSFLPYTSFIARNDAASPPVPMRNLRRVVPSRLAASSASSLTLYSTCFWSSVCGCGMYSPLETIRVGTGATNGSVSAGATRLCCASLSHESSSRLSGGRREFDHIELLPHRWVLNPPVRLGYLAAPGRNGQGGPRAAVRRCWPRSNPRLARAELAVARSDGVAKNGRFPAR